MARVALAEHAQASCSWNVARAFSQITGINAVLYYGSIIVSEHFPGQSTSIALIANVIIGAVNLLFTIVAMVFLDRWGRRAILIISSGGMTIALAFLVIGLMLTASRQY